MAFPSLDEVIGNTPLVKLQRLPGSAENTVLAKLEGNNPAGSVKDRPALGMIRGAEERGELRPGDTLIEATSGNTGIALAMVAAARGYSMTLIMPEHMGVGRRAVSRAFGATIRRVSKDGGMEEARDLAASLESRGEGRVLDQFANPDNPRAHYETTGPELWRDTRGSITHFVSAMGTTGTIMGVSRYLKEVNPRVQIIGVQPGDDSSIPGIRKWPAAYLPKIFDARRIDRIVEVSAEEAQQTTLELGRREGIFAGISSGGAMSVALGLARQLRDAVIVTVICDRGDRYVSTGLFDRD